MESTGSKEEHANKQSDMNPTTEHISRKEKSTHNTETGSNYNETSVTESISSHDHLSEPSGITEETPSTSLMSGVSKNVVVVISAMKDETEPNLIVPLNTPDNKTVDTKEDAHLKTDIASSADYLSDKKNDPERREDNLKFYRNEIASRPFPGTYIEDMLQWHGDYKKLENGHSYIQWLFPIPESSGLNSSAQELFPYEAEEIRNNNETQDRVLRAYKMMLNFYGMDLFDETSGEIRRCEANWKERFEHLNRSFHNYLRITRILKSLGELGYDRYQKPLVTFIIAESVINKTLPKLNADSMNYWITAIKDHSDMTEMYQLWQETCENPENFDEFGNKLNANGSETKLADGGGMDAGTYVAATQEQPHSSKDPLSSPTPANEDKVIALDQSNQNIPKETAKTDGAVANSEDKNLKFYRNEITSEPPPGKTIEDILGWFGKYEMIEKEHSKVRWLFPTSEPLAKNGSTQKLFLHEAEAIRDDTKLQERVTRAYEMMLDFYGMEMVDKMTGEIRRREAKWKERSSYLDGSVIECRLLPIIIRSLGELGLKRLKDPLIHFLVTEVKQELPTFYNNSMREWIEAIKYEDTTFCVGGHPTQKARNEGIDTSPEVEKSEDMFDYDSKEIKRTTVEETESKKNMDGNNEEFVHVNFNDLVNNPESNDYPYAQIENANSTESSKHLDCHVMPTSIC